MKTIIRAFALGSVLAGAFALPVQAEPLSAKTVKSVVKAMEDVARKAGTDLLNDPVMADPKALKIVGRHGFSAAEWQRDYGRVLAAFRLIETSPELLGSIEPEGDGGGPFGSLLSADTLSSLGTAAVFGGTDSVTDLGKQIAVEEAAKAAGNAIGDDRGHLSNIGSGVAHGGLDGAKQVGLQIAIDETAEAVAGMVSGGDDAARAAAMEDVPAVARYHNRIAELLDE